eukprot:5606973-Lingulodinium_polyedra.AAC.1
MLRHLRVADSESLLEPAARSSPLAGRCRVLFRLLLPPRLAAERCPWPATSPRWSGRARGRPLRA